MLQIVFRFLEEILWCNPMILDRILICSFRKANMMLEVIEVFNILHNYAICCKRFISFDLVICKKQNSQKIAEN